MYLQFTGKEGALLSIYSDKSSLLMGLADLLQVHVHNLTPLEVLVEEGNHHILGLGYQGEELLLCDLNVCSMAQSFVYLLLCVDFLRHG